jgi:hypothetical protein
MKYKIKSEISERKGGPEFDDGLDNELFQRWPVSRANGSVGSGTKVDVKREEVEYGSQKQLEMMLNKRNEGNGAAVPVKSSSGSFISTLMRRGKSKPVKEMKTAEVVGGGKEAGKVPKKSSRFLSIFSTEKKVKDASKSSRPRPSAAESEIADAVMRRDRQIQVSLYL